MLSKTVTIDYKNSRVTLAVKQRISGNELLFFIHVLGCAKENFDSVWDIRDLEWYAIIVPDLPGFGDSPALSIIRMTWKSTPVSVNHCLIVIRGIRCML
mgnify:CR=1 FL=1